MANQKISQLAESTTPGDNDLIPMVVDGVTVKVKKSALLQAVTTALAGKLDKTGGIFRAAVGEALNGYVGPYGSAALFYSTFVVSGNITPNMDGAGAFTGSWTVVDDDANNGAQMFVFTISSGLKFINIPPTGAVNVVYTDAQLAAMAVSLDPASKADKDLVTRTLTASGTLQLADRANRVRTNMASINNIVIPPYSEVPFPKGTQIVGTQAGTGQTTVVPGSFVTLLSSGDKRKFAGPNSSITFIKEDPADFEGNENVWSIYGDLVA